MYTVSQIIPAVKKVLGREEHGASPAPEEPTHAGAGGPPNRPDHDTQIAEFIREQHKSKEITGLEE